MCSKKVLLFRLFEPVYGSSFGRRDGAGLGRRHLLGGTVAACALFGIVLVLHPWNELAMGNAKSESKQTVVKLQHGWEKWLCCDCAETLIPPAQFMAW